MIGFELNYYQPSNLSEAVDLYRQCQLEGLAPLYYAGGTEILSLARRNELIPQALIDIKGIPECRVLQHRNNKFVYGSALSLTDIIESDGFPLLSETCRHVADHTNRNKITLGGTICGRTIYKEALLPFLLTDSQLVTVGRNGVRAISSHELFNEDVQFSQGDLLVQLVVEKEVATKPYIFVKRTKQEKIDYPLVSLAALKTNNRIRVAFSGVCAFPFRSQAIEEVINNQELPLGEQVSYALNLLPDEILDDILGSRDYRAFILQDLLMETIATLQEV